MTGPGLLSDDLRDADTCKYWQEAGGSLRLKGDHLSAANDLSWHTVQPTVQPRTTVQPNNVINPGKKNRPGDNQCFLTFLIPETANFTRPDSSNIS